MRAAGAGVGGAWERRQGRGAAEAGNKQNPGGSGSAHVCPETPSRAYLWSLAFEALGRCPQPTLPINGERSGEVCRVLGTGDAHLPGQRCWRPQAQPPEPLASLSEFPQHPSRSLSTPSPP